MPNQFSQEYIGYVLSDEAKALQDYMTVGFGTHVLSSVLGGERIAIVTGAENDPDAACDFYGIFEGSARSTDFDGSEVVVLPTLWDLLRIIEGAGYWWALGLNFDGDERWYDASGGRIDVDDYLMDAGAKDLMLAAAKLAVRALEGKKA